MPNVIDKPHKYIFEDCRAYYESKVESFHKRFKKKFMLSGSFSESGIGLSKSSSNLFSLFSPLILEEILTRESVIDIFYLENKKNIYHSEVNQNKSNLFLFTKYFKYDDQTFLFHLFLLKGDLDCINRFWL